MTENNTTNSENGLKNNREDPIVKEVPKSKNKERETWSGRFDFFLAALGYAGNFSNYQSKHKNFTIIIIS